MSETLFSRRSGNNGGRAARGRLVGRLTSATVALTAIALAVTACTSKSATGSDPTPSDVGASTSSAGTPPADPATGGSSSSPTAPPAKPVRIVATPGTRTDLNPLTPIHLTAKNGTLTSVQLLSSDGAKVSGTLSADKTTWQTSEVLGYGKTYKLVAKAVGDPKHDPSVSRTVRATFTTLTPPNMTMPYFQRPGGYALDNGATYGVGIVPIVHFDEPITDKAAAERALSVQTTPHVNGSWYWDPDTNQDVMYRPRNFWPSGTRVTVSVKDYGKQMSPGLYGQSDASISFKIGRKQVTVADDNAPKVDKVRVYTNDHLVRTMNTSMGKHTGIEVKGNWINFYTLEGTYTVIAHENPAIMSSASYGLPANFEGGYAPEKIYWATKISVDGIYLHELTTTIWYQDNGYDVSHGCLNLNTANATWFYNHSLIGDPVTIRHTGGPKIQLWQGGEWSIPWSEWKAGSALS